MSIQISRETEARLAEEARSQGISVELLLQRLLTERWASMIASNGPAPQLPVWHLGGNGAFHRRDIYDDAP